MLQNRLCNAFENKFLSNSLSLFNEVTLQEPSLDTHEIDSISQTMSMCHVENNIIFI